MRKATAYYRAMMALNQLLLIPTDHESSRYAAIVAHNAIHEILEGLPEGKPECKCHPSITPLVLKAEKWADIAYRKLEKENANLRP